jgi:hypothetical protein
MRKAGLSGGILFAIAAGVLSGCGGSTPPPDAPASPPPAPTTVTVPAPAPSATGTGTGTGAAATAAPAAAPAQAAWSDPNEKPDGYELTALFDRKKSKASFPKKTVGDGECWTSVGVTGDHDKDFAAIVSACGTPTGLAEYAKPIEGKLHHEHDPRDVYKMKVLSGYCYRYFAVADNGIKDLDLLIEKPGGALVGDDKTTSPVVIIESDQPWCQDDDQTLEFHVEVKAGSSDTGGYVLGVWARPKH